MRGRQNYICGLDIGNYEIRATIARVDNKEVSIFGIGKAYSKGIDRGNITNLGKLADSVQEAIEEAEDMANLKIASVYVNIASRFLKSYNSQGQINIADVPSEITERETERAIATSKLVSVPVDRQVLHLLPQEFNLDGQNGIKEPIGLYGRSLKAYVHIITAPLSLVQNVIKCIHNCGLGVEEIVCSGLASSYSLLSQDDKSNGIVVVDFGYGTISILAYIKGNIKYSEIIPFGGKDLTNLLQKTLNVDFQTAERIKINPEVSKDSASCPIIFTQIKKILYYLKKKLEKNLISLKEIPCVTMTGGTSLIDGVIEEAEKIFDKPVKLGFPKKLNSKFTFVNSPIYSISFGLILYAWEKKNQKILHNSTDGSFLARTRERIKNVFSEYF